MVPSPQREAIAAQDQSASLPLCQPCADTLLPCPFCGGDASVWEFKDRGFDRLRIVCDSCIVMGPQHPPSGRPVAIASWNHRVSFPSIPEEPK